MFLVPLRSLEWASSEYKALTPEARARALRARRRIIDTIEHMLELPEWEVDLWRVSLTLANDRDPSLDIRAYTEEFEAIVSNAAKSIPEDADPDTRIRALNSFLYREVGIEYDHSDFHAKNPDNRHIYGVVKRRKGICGNLAEFYIAVGRC